MNRIILMGNLARDIEVKYAGKQNTAIGSTAIATNRRYKGNDGEQKEEVMFIDITFFGRTAEVAKQYLAKGSQVLIEGRLVLDQWVVNDSKRSKHSVHVESLEMIGTRENTQSDSTQNERKNDNTEIDVDEDNLPFP